METGQDAGEAGGMKRKVIHVTYRNAEDRWTLKGGDGSFDTKAEAVDAAKRQAKSAALGQVVIHSKIGGIQTEHTYGRDPRDRKG
jgi:hypothetical protein